MRIGADASHLRWSRAGVGTYLDGMLHAVENTLTGADSMVAYDNAFGGERLFGDRVEERHLRMPGSLAWNQVGLPLALLRSRCDVFLGGANLIPVAARLPRVLVVHDCKAFRVPEADSAGWVRYMRRWMRASARSATRVVAVSHWAAREAEHFLNVPETEIAVIHQGVDHDRFRPADAADAEQDERALARLGVHPRFVLQVGGFERHKGGDTALAAIPHLRAQRPDLTLVRCGQKGGTGTAPGVVDLGYVGARDLVALYRSAAAVCVPSRHEGFGRPVVEAMACGTPVVASKTGGLPEAGGDAAVYVPAGDADALAAALAGILDDAREAARCRDAGLLQAARFCWDTAGAAMRAVLDTAAAVSR